MSKSGNTIDRYCHSFRTDYVPALALGKDVNKVYSIKRRDVLKYEFPPVDFVDELDISISPAIANTTSYYYKLSSIPSLTTIQSIINRCSRIGDDAVNSVITIKGNAFTFDDIESILRIHALKDLKRQVESEMQWFLLPAGTINSTAMLDEHLIQEFSDLLQNGVNNRCVNPAVPYVLFSDIANFAGTKWINLTLINTFVAMLNSCQSVNKVFTLSTLNDVLDDTLKDIVDSWKYSTVRGCTVVLNVKRTERGDETLVANKGEFGSHWSCVFINFETNIIYSDSLAWPMPINLDTTLRRLLNNLERVFQTPFNIGNSTIAHKHENSITKCGQDCLNLPYQAENMDICGLACLLAAMMFCQSSELSKNELSWVTRLDKHNVFVRRYFICCYMKNIIDFELFHDTDYVICNLDEQMHEANDTHNGEPANTFVVDEHNFDEGEPQEPVGVNPIESDHVHGCDGTAESLSQISDETFKVGRKFSSYYEVKDAIKVFENNNGIQIRIFSSSTLEASKKKAPKRVTKANPLLEYYYLNLCCKFSGAPEERDRTRKTSSMRQSCPFYIGISLSGDGQFLEVKKFVNDHNDHMISKEFIKHLPRQRALNEEEKDFAKKAFLLKGNKKMIQQKLLSQGKKVTLKDLSNLQQQCKVANGNEIKSLVDDLKKRPGSTVELIVNDENEFGALFYQDTYMKDMYKMYPEMIMVDATFKLLDSRYPFFLIMVIDGNGLSEIVGVFILSEETKVMIEAAVKLFQKHNPSYGNTKVVMSDKDFAERDVFARLFPDSTLLICLFHTLRTFKREITCEKMGLTSGQRNRCLEILEAITYSHSPEDYEKNVSLLINSPYVNVIDYFKSNWEPIKEQWVMCYKDEALSLGESTNNRLESTFQKVKSVCSKFSTMRQFFNEFFMVLECLRNERINQFFMALTKRSNNIKSRDDMLFSELVTPYALQFILKEKNTSLKCSYQVNPSSDGKEFKLVGGRGSYKCSVESCSCNYMKKMALPCHHIFYLRQHLNVPLYDDKAVNKRWTRQNYVLTSSTRCQEDQQMDVPNPENCNVTFLKEEKTNEQTILSQGQKMKKMRNLYQDIVAVGCEGGMAVFTSRFKELQSLLQRWRNKEDIPSLTASCDDDGINATSMEVPILNDDALNDVIDNNLLNNLQSVHDEPSSNDSIQLDDIKLPPTMLKRGRPKGAEVTVIGLPKKKKRTGVVIPFHKLQPNEKDRILLECFVSSVSANEAITGKKFITIDDICDDLQAIPDIVKDNSNIDINRIQRYFVSDAWSHILALLTEKVKQPFTCTVCNYCIVSDGIGVMRSLLEPDSFNVCIWEKHW